MEIKRDLYLNKLINKKNNHLIKILTGLRRSGKTYLLFNLFKNYLLKIGISKDQIIEMSFDIYSNKKYREPDEFLKWIDSKINNSDQYYLLLDEVQLLNDFEAVLNELLRKDNLDIYVSGSNARFLSKDIITEFRGRGDQIHLNPLSFKEFYSVYKGTKEEAWNEFYYTEDCRRLFYLPHQKKKLLY